MDKNRLEFKKKLEQLRKYRGRHTELVTVMIPDGYDLNIVLNQIIQEKGTASNIKSKKTRTNVMTALERIAQHLSLFKKTPEHGLAVFCGNVGRERDEWVLESIIPPEPLQTRVYRCDQTFFLEPFKDMLKAKNVYGLVTIERGGATIGLLRGKRIDVLKTVKSIVPGKFRAGGQSAQRFERVREAMTKDFFKEVAENVRDMLGETKGILLGGPGPTKEDFFKVLPPEVQKRVIAVKDTGYSDEYGLKELVDKSEDVLAQTEMVHEKRVLEEFFKRIAKGEPVEYGRDVKKALQAGAVETLLLSEDLPKDTIDEFLELAEPQGVKVEFISTETSEGKEFMAMSGVGALLRYA